jgi:chromosome segregation ATPase
LYLDYIRQGVDKKNQEISKIMEKLEESEQKTSQTEGKFLKLNEIFGNNISKLKVENEGLKSKMNILETKIMENESKNNQELSNKTNEEIVKLKKLIEEKDLILKEKDDVLNNLEKDFIQFKHNEKSLMEEKTSLLSRVRGSMKSFEELHIKTSELDKEKSQLRKEIEASNLKVKNFEEEISMKTKQNEKIISEYQNTIER